MVRFDGDQERADAVYAGLTPLVADDVAEVISFVASRPPHVNLDEIVIKPRDRQCAAKHQDGLASAALAGVGFAGNLLGALFECRGHVSSNPRRMSLPSNVLTTGVRAPSIWKCDA